MTVHCPHCSTGYLLPDHLMGPRGARVRCPHCKRDFVVLREEMPVAAGGGEATMEDEPTGSATPMMDGAEPSQDGAPPSRVAHELLDALALRLGGALEEARHRGRVLAEFGPDVMQAFDQYRQRLGERAEPAAFRTALKERWGVDLTS